MWLSKKKLEDMKRELECDLTLKVFERINPIRHTSPFYEMNKRLTKIEKDLDILMSLFSKEISEHKKLILEKENELRKLKGDSLEHKGL